MSVRYSGLRPITLTGTIQPLLAPNAHRKAVLFSPPASGTYTVSPEQTFALGEGLTLTSTSPVLTLTLEQHGTIVQAAWWILASGTTTAAMMETQG